METNHKIRQAVFGGCQGRYSTSSVIVKELLILKVSRKDFSENLNNRANIYLVAVNEADDPVGFVSCQGQTLLITKKKSSKSRKSMSPESRDRGIGKALFAALRRGY